MDDNKEALFIYEKYLKGTRFQIVPATSLKEARRALREFRPSAVILDVLLQGEHSWDLLQEIKLDPAMNAISVFVVTVIDNREKALALGADGFHPKPIERNWLIRELERACTQPTKRLLIVDDDEVSRYLVRTILGTHDFAIAEAASGTGGPAASHRRTSGYGGSGLDDARHVGIRSVVAAQGGSAHSRNSGHYPHVEDA